MPRNSDDTLKTIINNFSNAVDSLSTTIDEISMNESLEESDEAKDNSTK